MQFENASIFEAIIKKLNLTKNVIRILIERLRKFEHVQIRITSLALSVKNYT